jgi:hypothetical protein
MAREKDTVVDRPFCIFCIDYFAPGCQLGIGKRLAYGVLKRALECDYHVQLCPLSSDTKTFDSSSSDFSSPDTFDFNSFES